MFDTQLPTVAAAQWLTTPQALSMTLLAEQVHAVAAGRSAIVPGSQPSPELADFLTSTYPAVAGVAGDCDKVLRVLAADRAQLVGQSSLVWVVPEVAELMVQQDSTVRTRGLPHVFGSFPATFAWMGEPFPAASQTVMTPGAVGSDAVCCAVTVSTGADRLLEWCPMPSEQELGADLCELVERAGGGLPQWWLARDFAGDGAVGFVRGVWWLCDQLGRADGVVTVAGVSTDSGVVPCVIPRKGWCTPTL